MRTLPLLSGLADLSAILAAVDGLMVVTLDYALALSGVAHAALAVDVETGECLHSVVRSNALGIATETTLVEVEHGTSLSEIRVYVICDKDTSWETIFSCESCDF